MEKKPDGSQKSRKFLPATFGLRTRAPKRPLKHLPVMPRCWQVLPALSWQLRNRSEMAVQYPHVAKDPSLLNTRNRGFWRGSIIGLSLSRVPNLVQQARGYILRWGIIIHVSVDVGRAIKPVIFPSIIK